MGHGEPRWLNPQDLLRYQEFYLWGKGELEDFLFQARYDHLLFAYFGISLRTRRRSLKTEIRSEIAIKRQLTRALGPIDEQPAYVFAFVQPPTEEFAGWIKAHDYLESTGVKPLEFRGHFPLGHIAFVLKEHFAYVNWETEEWDAWKACDASDWMNLRQGLTLNDDDDAVNNQVNEAYVKHADLWEKHVPEGDRAMFYLIGTIPYERILVVDDVGDIFRKAPHIIVEPRAGGYLFDEDQLGVIKKDSSAWPRRVYPVMDRRIDYFDKVMGEPRTKD